MAEVHANKRVFLQPDSVITFVERVASTLPQARIHYSEHGSSHVPWTSGHAVALMSRAGEGSTRHHRTWLDYTTGTRRSYLSYEPTGDAFVTRPSPIPPVFGNTGKRGGVGSESQVGSASNPFPVTPLFHTPGPQEGVAPTQVILPVPPLDVVRRDPARTRFVRALALPQEELAAILELTRALGAASHRSWTVGRVISTLGAWILAQSDEARGLRHDLEVHTAELQRLQQELTSLRSAYERAQHDRERYRRERDSLRASRSRISPVGGASLRGPVAPVVRDPYANYGSDPPSSRAYDPRDQAARVDAQDFRLAMLSLAEVDAETPPYPGYCPPHYYNPGSRVTPNDTSR